MDESSSELLLLDDSSSSLRLEDDQIGISMPETSRVTKRKAFEEGYDDEDAGLSKYKYFKSECKEISSKPFLPKTKTDSNLVEGGNYYITVVPQNAESGIVSKVLVQRESDVTNKDNHILNSDDENGNQIVLMNKDDWNLCSLKGDEDESDLRIISVRGSNSELAETRREVAGRAMLGQGDDPVGENGVVDPVRTMWVTRKADKLQLKNSGHTWKSGKWKREEITLLKANIEKYCQEHNMADPQQIIFHATKEERKNFYPTISQGLNRPVFAVYRRVKRMYDTQNYRGKYSEAEVKQLKDLYTKHGRDWTMIGQIMGRSSDSVKDRCRLFLESERVTGKWTEGEEAKLAEAVYMVTGEKQGTSITGNISWGSVADMVVTRTEKQCRAKWLNYMNWKLCNGDDWTKTNEWLLIEKLKLLNVTSEEEIDWEKLSTGLSSSRSPQWLRAKWWNLKKLYLSENPNVTSITLRELLEQLHQIISKQILNSWERNEQHGKITTITEKYDTNTCDVSGRHTKSGTAVNCGLDKTAESLYMRKHLPTVANAAQQSVEFDRNDTAHGDFQSKEAKLPPSQHRKVISTAKVMKPSKHGGKSAVDKESDNYIASNQEKESQDVDENVNHTIQLTPTSTSGVFLLQNPESNNALVVFVSDDVDNMNITLSPEVLSLLNRTKVENEPAGEGLGDQSDLENQDDVQAGGGDMSMVPSHHDVITTSDVLVYQETINDDDIKNPVLSSAIHEVVATGGQDNEDDDCFMQTSSSPLQGTLLEGTDLATTTIRIDGAQ